MKKLYDAHPFLSGIFCLFSGLVITLAFVLAAELFSLDVIVALVEIIPMIAVPAGMVLAAICFIRVIRLEPKDTSASRMKTGFCAMVVVMAPFFVFSCAASLIKLMF